MKSISARIHQAVATYENCPAAFRSCASEFANALSTSHTLTSRRYSVWALIKLHLDQPFAIALAYSGPWDSELLEGFRPSTGWRQPGASVLARLATYPSVRHLCAPSSHAPDTSPADEAIHAMERWIQCLRLAIHSCDDARGIAPPASKSFTSALDLMREILHLLKRLRPSHRNHAELGRVPDQAPGSEMRCELCWRPSMRWAATTKTPHLLSSGLKSARFCDVHDPSNPKSRYRTDLRYKAAFLQELDAVCNFSASAFAFELPGLPHADEHMLRRLAYDRVHAGVRSPNARKDPSLKERVWMLLQEGRSQSEIARELGISRQAVSSARQKLTSIWEDHQLRLQEYLLP